jgi:hypothetical protein
MKKGRYAKPGVKTGYGYHTAIASSYINRNTGEKIDETEYNKLSPEKKQQFEEKAELHEIRPYSARPFQAGPLNMESYGFATVGKVTPAKIEAMKTHLAKLYAEGKITREALDKIFGHGELQKHGGRGHMEHGGEGAPMASALRRSIDDILKRAEQIKKEQQEKKPETQQTPAPAPTPAPQPPRAETDAVPVPSTQTVNTRLAEMIKNEAMQRDKMESTPQSTPTENKPSVAPQSQTASYDNSSRPSMVSATNNWAPNLRSAQSYITETPKQQSAQA